MVEFVDFTSYVFAASGVYMLLLRGRVVYVGQSLNVMNRLCAHRNSLRKLLKGRSLKRDEIDFRFDQVLVRWCPEEELDQVERELIQHYQPPGNVQRRGVPQRVPLDMAVLGVLTRQRLAEGFVRRI